MCQAIKNKYTTHSSMETGLYRHGWNFNVFFAPRVFLTCKKNSLDWSKAMRLSTKAPQIHWCPKIMDISCTSLDFRDKLTTTKRAPLIV